MVKIEVHGNAKIVKTPEGKIKVILSGPIPRGSKVISKKTYSYKSSNGGVSKTKSTPKTTKPISRPTTKSSPKAKEREVIVIEGASGGKTIFTPEQYQKAMKNPKFKKNLEERLKKGTIVRVYKAKQVIKKPTLEEQKQYKENLIKEIKEGKKTAWVSPKGKVFITSSPHSAPAGMRGDVAIKKGWKILKPKDIVSTSEKETITKASPEDVVNAITEVAEVASGKRIAVSPFTYKVIKELEKREEENELREKEEEWRKKLGKQALIYEFTKAPKHVKIATGMRFFLTKLMTGKPVRYALANEEEKKEMLYEELKAQQEERKHLTKFSRKNPLYKTVEEGAGQIPLLMGMGNIASNVVGKGISSAYRVSRLAGAGAKGIAYGLGATAVAVPSIDVATEVAQKNMNEAITKATVYGTEFASFSVGATLGEPNVRYVSKSPKEFKIKTTTPKEKVTLRRGAPKVENKYWTPEETVKQLVIRQEPFINEVAYEPLEKVTLTEPYEVRFPTKVPRVKEDYIILKGSGIHPKYETLNIGKTLKFGESKIVGIDEYNRIVFRKGNRIYHLEGVESPLHPDYVNYRVITNIEGEPKVILKGVTKIDTFRKMGKIAEMKEFGTKKIVEKPKIISTRDIIEESERNIQKQLDEGAEIMERRGTSQLVKTEQKPAIRTKVKVRKSIVDVAYERMLRYAKMPAIDTANMGRILGSIGLYGSIVGQRQIAKRRRRIAPLTTLEKRKLKIKRTKQILLMPPKPIQKLTPISKLTKKTNKIITRAQQQLITAIPDTTQILTPKIRTETPIKPKITPIRKKRIAPPFLPPVGLYLGGMERQINTSLRIIEHRMAKITKLL